MCRSKIPGQKPRRCPSHKDPAQIAKRNAKRRQTYAVNKTLQGFGDLDVNGVVQKSAFLRGVPKASSRGYSVDSAYSRYEEPTFDAKYGVTFIKNDGELIRNHYLAETEIAGVLDPERFDQDTPEAFGFQKVKPVGSVTYRYASPANELDEYGKVETSSLSPDERVAVKFFTSNQHGWVGDALYGNPKLVPDGDAYESKFDASKLHDYDAGEVYLDDEEHTPSALRELTGLLDSALEKGPGLSRIVYRGVPADTGNAGEVEVGETLTFDSYQSTSMNAKQAAIFANNNDKSAGGTVYEILTPEGVNVMSETWEKSEQEVTLPRGCRYVVVGKHSGDLVYEDRYVDTVVQLVAVDEKGAALNSLNRHKTKPLSEEQLSA